MSVTTQSSRSVWPRLISFVFSPRLLLSVLWIAAIGGSMYSAPWGVPLFWAALAVTVAATLFALAGARPLPPLKEHSHLLLRLSWLGRYAMATVVLCLSTFLGALAGAQAGIADMQVIVDHANGLIGLVASFAAQIAAVLFFGWLAIDLRRMGHAGRQEGIERSLQYFVGPRLGAASARGPVGGWLLALSSPPMAIISLAAIVIKLLLAFNALEH